MAWSCVAAKGTGLLVFIGHVTADSSGRVNSVSAPKDCKLFWLLLDCSFASFELTKKFRKLSPNCN